MPRPPERNERWLESCSLRTTRQFANSSPAPSAEEGHELTPTADGAAALAALDCRDGEFDLLPVMDGIALALAAGRD